MIGLELELAGGLAIVAPPAAVLIDRELRGRRYRRTLRNIARLERELLDDPANARDFDRQIQSAVDARRRRVVAPSYGAPVARSSNWAPVDGEHGYQGPELTDEDVRRLEHPNEFLGSEVGRRLQGR